MFKEYLKISIRNLRARPLRSWLTILGVVIGVFLVISLLSLSKGIEKAVLQELKMMGKDVIMVFPGELTDFVTTFMGGLELSDDDLIAIKKAEGVDLVIPLIWKAEVMRYAQEKKTILISGAPWDELEFFKSDMGWSLTEGRWPGVGKREIVVGSLVPEDIFPGMKTGTQATIQGRQFEIAGVLRSLGNKQDDSMVILDLGIFREITGKIKGAQSVFVKTEEGISVDRVAENIKEQLEETRKRKRGEDLPSFSVITSEKAMGIVGNIMAIVQLAVFAFASIAILIGGIGIMNTMHTAVHERIREIGILKAVGAKKSNIIAIFLAESGIIGLIGGAGGVILGLVLAKIVEIYFQFHPVLYLEASISPGIIIFGLVFSFLVGCFSGYLPARRAAKLKPVDALRYE